jgi:protein SCO1/2
MVRTKVFRARRRSKTTGKRLPLSSVRAALLALPPLWLVACSENSGGGEADDDTTYEIRGVVRDLEPADSTLIIEHEDVPGFMPSMTMPFTVRDPAAMEGVEIGDALSFEFVVRDEGSWIHNLRPVDAADLVLPEPEPRRTVEAEHVEEGDPMPPFALVDQLGREIGPETFAGRPFVLTFVFTRCAVPDFCPLMSSRFAELESLIRDRPDLLERTNLLSISIDPEHDTPEVLDDYADRYTDDDDFWRFATGDPDEVAKLTKAFRVYTETAGGTLNHGLCTALVDAEGTVRNIWRGNAWKPADVFDALTESTAP